MGHKLVQGFLLAVFLVFFCPCLACAMEVSSEELINHALEHDGKEVVYTGELIETVLKRGSFVWLNLSDGKNVIGVWAGRDLASPVKVAGSYTHIGDIIKVKGIFHRSCVEHGGGLDIHALGLKVVAQGSEKVHYVERYKVVIIMVLLGVLSCLLIARILLKRSRQS